MVDAALCLKSWVIMRTQVQCSPTCLNSNTLPWPSSDYTRVSITLVVNLKFFVPLFYFLISPKMEFVGTVTHETCLCGALNI